MTNAKRNYLLAIAHTEDDGAVAIGAELARRMGITPTAVCKAAKQLKQEGFIAVADGGRFVLTHRGTDVLNRTRFRRQLLERMLTEIFGMERRKVQMEAEQLEWALSDEFEQKLIEKLRA